MTVLEAAGAPGDELRASTFHPPTLDLFDTLDGGVTRELLRRGLVCPSWQIRLHSTGERAEFDLSVLAGETGHPYRLQCPQRELSLILTELLSRRYGVEIQLGHRVTALRQDDTSVYLTASDELPGSDESVEIPAAFVIGADGARSTARKAIGVSFPGFSYPETTILATTTFPFADHLPGLSNVNYVWADRGTFSLLRLPDLWRCSLYPDDGQSLEHALTPESIQRKMREIVPAAEPFDLGQVRPYPPRCKEHLMRTSMISGLRRSKCLD